MTSTAEYVANVAKAINEIQTTLPGWWWNCGTCHLTDDASLGPDYNDPAHCERLRQEFPEELFDGGFDVALSPAGDLPAALREALKRALTAIEKHWRGELKPRTEKTGWERMDRLESPHA